MHRLGHYGAALIGYAPIGFIAAVLVGLELAIVGGGVAIALSMVPDWDIRIPGVKHRGVTHTVHFAIVVGGVVGIVGLLLGLQAGIAVGIVLGLFGFVVGAVSIGSHIAADALTPAGVDPFMTGETISYDVTRAANPIANYALLVLGIGVTIAAMAGASVLRSG